MIFGPKTAQNCIISNPLNLSPAMSPLRHRSVFGAKSAENGELRKVRFFVSCVFCAAWASKFARFPPKTCSRCLQCSEIRFLARKTSNSSPPSLSPPMSPVSNTSARSDFRLRWRWLAQTEAVEPASLFQAFCALFGPKESGDEAVTSR